MSLRVVVDATAIPPDRGGVGRYVDQVLTELQHVDIDLQIACQASDAQTMATLAPTAEIHPAPARIAGRLPRMVWEQTGLPALVKATGAQVLWSPHYTMPVRPGVPTVVTLHDATFFSHPTLHLRAKRLLFTNAIRRAVSVASGCVVPSAATASEIAKFTGCSAGRMQVIPHGVDHDLFKPQPEVEVQALAQRIGVRPRHYVAFLGTLEPRKNVPALIRGWTQACAGMSDPPALVLAGGKGWDHDVEPAIAAVPEHLSVIRTGYLPLADLPRLLAGALVVAYPAFGEGFGLPLLEAMACGAAALTTPYLSLPEVGGEAVHYTEPDAAAIAIALQQMWGNPAELARLRQAALARAATYTWRRSAEEHLVAFDKAHLNAKRG